MTPRAAGLGDMPAITAGFRPFQPAPTAAGPGDPTTVPWPNTGPCVTDPGLTRWAPNANRQRLTAATSDTDDLIAGSRADVADVHTTIARHRAALREVA